MRVPAGRHLCQRGCWAVMFRMTGAAVHIWLAEFDEVVQAGGL